MPPPNRDFRRWEEFVGSKVLVPRWVLQYWADNLASRERRDFQASETAREIRMQLDALDRHEKRLRRTKLPPYGLPPASG
jgi:hypothetical protein